MNQPHIIRIRGPWMRHAPSCSDRGAADRIQMPWSWADEWGDTFDGIARFERAFHAPTGIDDATHIELEFVQSVGYAVVSLNEQVLGTIDWPCQTNAFNVTGKLKPRNQIVVEIKSLSNADIQAFRSREQTIPRGGLVGEVQLRIG